MVEESTSSVPVPLLCLTSKICAEHYWAGQYVGRPAGRPSALLAAPLPVMPGRARPSERVSEERRVRSGKAARTGKRPRPSSRPSLKPRRGAAPTIRPTPPACKGVGTR